MKDRDRHMELPDEVEVAERWYFEQFRHHKKNCNKHWSRTLAPILQCTCGADKIKDSVE